MLASWAVWIWAVGPACAQFSRHANDIELKGLDVHPKPVLLNETGTQIYGTLDVGIRSHEPTGDGRCGRSEPARFAGSGASTLGFRGTEVLAGGWRAVARLEQGFDAASGTLANDCGVVFDRALLVGLSHAHWGQLHLGRHTHPAYDAALRADPWAGAGVASPGDAAYYARPVNPGGVVPDGSTYRVRAPEAVTYTSAQHRPLWVSAQVSLRRSAEFGVYAGQPDQREAGLALHFQHGALHAALSYQRWNPESWAAPATLTYAFDPWTLHAGWTGGQLATGRYSNALVGATYHQRSGAFMGSYRVAMNRHEGVDGAVEWKLGLGQIRPWSRRTQLELAAGLVIQEPGRQQLLLGLSLRHQFSL